MDQQKIGDFLKKKRKEKGLTQEQLAEHFYVSSRTVSRWETGSNLPDIVTLVNLAEFYDVDIREIIDGEGKSDKMEDITKETVKKVAEYAEEEKTKVAIKIKLRLLRGLFVILFGMMLFSGEYKGLLNGIIPEEICTLISSVILIFAAFNLIEAFIFLARKRSKSTCKNKNK